MIQFNERVHAYIAAKYYVYLTESFGERGRQAFLHATRYYAEQRGRRMAQRAIRDGRTLDFGTYQEYGEWVSTPEMIEGNMSNQSEVTSWSPDLTMKITRCPWHLQFASMGLVEAGHDYCSDLDCSICRGFNPELQYDVLQTLHKSDCCIHIVRNAGFAEGEAHPKKMEYVRDFEYHCAHSYWSYADITKSVFGSEGEMISSRVLADLAADYSRDMADTLMKYRDTDFNLCD